MRSLDSASSQSAYSRLSDIIEKAASRPAESSKPIPTKRAFRFRADSWLPESDANLLLRKRAQIDVQQANYNAALTVLNRLVQYEAQNANNFANRGLVHYHLGHYSKALADYDQAIALNPELDKAYSNRANLHATQQNWTEALADYDRAIDLNPLNIRARLNQSVTLREIGDYKEALIGLDVALFFQPQSATLHAERGRTYHLRGDWNCAIADYNTALQLTQNTSLNDISSATRIQCRVTRWISCFQ